MDAENSSVFELEGEWQTDPIGGIISRIKVDGTFDAVKSGNRQTGVVDECLVSSDRVFDVAQNRSIQNQFSAASKFFDKLKHEHAGRREWDISRGEERRLATKGTKRTKGRSRSVGSSFFLLCFLCLLCPNFLPLPR